VTDDLIFEILVFIPDVTAIQEGHLVQQVAKVSGGHYLSEVKE
jgi:hypothetical protein